MQRLPGVLVPADGGFSLVGDADALDLGDLVAVFLELLDGFFNALVYGGDEFLRIMFMPATYISSAQVVPGKE